MLNRGIKLAMAVAAVAITAGAHAASKGEVAVTTPAGITLQEVAGGGRFGGEEGASSGEKKTPGFLPGYSGRRSADRGYWIANEAGLTVYTYDKDTTPGKSVCVAECLAAWPAAVAPAGAKASGDWTIITRDDGVKQWAFKGKPLYTFAKEPGVGESKGNGAGGGVWHAVKLAPDSFVAGPYGIGIRDSRTASGYVLVNNIGSVAYAYNGKGEPKSTCATSVCPTRWEPIQAPNLAHPVGDFTLVDRADGMRQWAYKGKALYTFSGDLMSGDAFGTAANKDFELAIVGQNFIPATASIAFDPGRGPMIATKAGMTLYRLDTSFHTPDGHGLPGSQSGSPKVGRTMGTAACDSVCLKTWKPFVAGANDAASGHWSIMVREDGTRQWAYKGFALYTYPGDKKPGDRAGSDIYDILTSDDPKKDEVYKETKFGQNSVRGSDSAANFWSYVEP